MSHQPSAERWPPHDHDLELERYEFDAPPPYRFQLDRREFLKAVGGGLAVVLLLRPTAAGQRAPGRGQQRQQDTPIGAWLHIGADGAVSAYTGKVEIGQDTRTGVALVVAEELAVPVESVAVVMGDTDLVPYDRGTWGSQSTPRMLPEVRRAAAAARELLVDLAAARWEVDRGEVRFGDGLLHHDDGRTLAFGDLTAGEELVQTIDAEMDTIAPADWRVCGRPTPAVNGRAIVTGAHEYTSDLRRPGQLVGKVARPPSRGAVLAGLALEAARAVPGVTVVHDGDFVGVAGPDEASVDRALAALEPDWDTAAVSPVTHDDLFTHLKETAEPGRGRRSRGTTIGSMEAGLEAADLVHRQTYTLPFIAHVPLETRAAVAEWTDDGRLSVWASTQSPFGVRAGVAEALHLDESQIRVRVPDIGSGYGGKTRSHEVAVEAARLAKAAGRPVRVVWSREEEFRHAYFRPAGVIEVESGVTKDGKLTAWRFHNINSGGSAVDPPYAIPHQEVAVFTADAPLAQGSYRALAATANHFARERHMDDVARELGMDPLAFRLANLEEPRLLAVLNAAAERFGWGRRSAPEGRGFGLACGYDKGSVIATCAEVAVEEGRPLRVEHVVAAYECGAILNPDNVTNQLEGGIVQGLGGALLEGIEFENGRILNASLGAYKVPRFRDTPTLETVLLDRPDEPSVGCGETPIVAIAPAIGNAVLAATGRAHHAMPMS